jgi:hypothetical protein
MNDVIVASQDGQGKIAGERVKRENFATEVETVLSAPRAEADETGDKSGDSEDRIDEENANEDQATREDHDDHSQGGCTISIRLGSIAD